MIFHLTLNSFIVFIFLALLIECSFFVFGIKSSRIRALCRSLAVIKLPFDFLIFSLYGESVFVNFNPFSCEMYVQGLLMNLFPAQIQIKLHGMEHLIVPEYIIAQLPATWLSIFIIGITTITVGITARKFIQYLNFLKSLNKILHSSPHCTRLISNKYLQGKLLKLDVLILTSSLVHTPLAASQRYIIFPENLVNEFSQEEYEAVIAHEVEHLRWKDPLFKLFCITICTLFWWIPTAWWLKRLEADQEEASDAALRRYGLDTYPLATALMKVMNSARSLRSQIAAICYLDTSRSTHIRRLEKMLSSEEGEDFYNLNAVFGIFTCFLIFMSFWMC